MELRGYQIALEQQLHDSWAGGHQRPCIVLPCGGGKTVVVADVAKKTTLNNGRVLFLVHRTELVDQTVETFAGHGVMMDLCHVGMVQTITRHLELEPEPKLIITDENHHCLARSYQRIYRAFPNAYCVGITATPQRLDGRGLSEINDDLIIGPQAQWLIENKYLSPVRVFAPRVITTVGLKTVRGDYDVKNVVMDRGIYGDVIMYYQKYADGLKAICYLPSVAKSAEMAERFNAAGIPAAHIDGTTLPQIRDAIIEKFRSGEIMVLCNVDLISEGFDVPDCSCALLCRPTQSLTLYIQQSMRCMRYRPGKTAIVIDYCGNVYRHGLPDDDRSWDLNAKKKTAKQRTAEIHAKECPDCLKVVPMKTHICPHCGHVFVSKKRDIEEFKAEVKEIRRGIVMDYKTPDECANYGELLAYAEAHGYKRGWAWYQAKLRGFIR